MARFAQHLAEAGALRAGVTPDEARDVLWTINSHAVYPMLVGERAEMAPAGESRGRAHRGAGREETPARSAPKLAVQLEARRELEVVQRAQQTAGRAALAAGQPLAAHLARDLTTEADDAEEKAIALLEQAVIAAGWAGPLRAEARFLYRLAEDDPTRGVPPWVTTAGETTEIATVLADATRRIGEVHGQMHDRQRALDHEARDAPSGRGAGGSPSSP